MTYGERYHLTHCTDCDVGPDELFCVNEEREEEPAAWVCVACVRARHPGKIEPEWEMLRSTEPVRGSVGEGEP